MKYQHYEPTCSSLMDTFELSPLGPTTSPFPIAGELSTLSREVTPDFDDLFPGLLSSTSHEPDGSIPVSTGSPCGVDYGASCEFQWQDCNATITKDQRAADVAAINAWHWPRRMRATEESGTSNGGVRTHLVSLFATTVDLPNPIEL